MTTTRASSYRSYTSWMFIIRFQVIRSINVASGDQVDICRRIRHTLAMHANNACFRARAPSVRVSRDFRFHFSIYARRQRRRQRRRLLYQRGTSNAYSSRDEVESVGKIPGRELSSELSNHADGIEGALYFRCLHSQRVFANIIIHTRAAVFVP